MQEGLTYDDILIVPNYSEVLPTETNLETKFSRNIPLKIPISSSPMDTVTEHQMAIALALEGGIGIIHKNLSPKEQADEVKKVKRFENGFIKEPLTVGPDETIEKVHQIYQDLGYKKIPVVNEKNILLGIITEFYYDWPKDKDTKVAKLMKPINELIVAKDGITLKNANQIIKKEKLAVLCIVDKNGKLRSIVTHKDLEKNREYPNANKDSGKSLLVGAAISTGDEMFERALLLEKAGVDVIVVDTAHGHSKNVIDMVKKIKTNKTFQNVDVVAGNVATKEAVKDLANAGADGIKVGIGPGSICTTRIIAGIGVPQITALMESVKGLPKNNPPSIIADGGISYSGDIVKAIAVGADCVMLGGLLAGSEEAPGETLFINGRMFKSYRGMGSLSAMKAGSKDRYGQGKVKEVNKFVPEGIEGRIPYRGPVNKNIYQLIGGLRSGMGYIGAENIKELKQKVKIIKMTGAGQNESHPHNIIITEDAPNYKRK